MFDLIVAVSKKNGIGKDNTIPWKIKPDLKYFKNITTEESGSIYPFSNFVIMGRKTWESIPKEFRPLSNRYNIILSNSDIKVEDGVSVFNSLDKALNFCNSYTKSFEDKSKQAQLLAERVYWDEGGKPRIFVIGGERVYKEALEHSLCNRLYITQIYKDYDCDKFFPNISNGNKKNLWQKFYLESVSKFQNYESIYFRYLVYKNIKNSSPYINHWENIEEQQYLNTLQDIKDNGIENLDRTGVGTLSLFGKNFNYNLRDTFPILTTRRIFFRAVFEELMLYLRGQTNNNILKDKGIHIWDGNTSREFLDKRGLSEYSEGDMGETYGFNFRHFGGEYKGFGENYTNQGFDQLGYVINLIKNDPNSRRIIINLWNPKTLHKATLPSCLCQYQFYVDTKKKELSLQIYIRSSDFYLANNWNTCTGGLLVHLLCNTNGIDLTPGDLIVCTGDTHIYKTHLECVRENLEYAPKPFPKLVIKKELENIEDFEYSDLELIGYSPIKNYSKASMAV